MDESSTSGSPPRAQKRMSRRALVLSVSIVAALASATVFGLLAFTTEEEQVQVLVTAAPLAAGQTVSGADLAEVTVDADAVLRLRAMSAEEADAVVGQTVAIPLAAGALVTAEVIGKARTPSSGQVEATVLAADGRWPETLQAGQSVSVMATAADGTIWQASAVAHRVTVPDTGGALITVALAEADAVGLAGVEPTSLLVVVTAPAVTGGQASAEGGGN
ncbi:SAF domain-containing protein [Glycomyces sp. TRM65418]|uniref:SAF domain-containing protein n=1 Tax=Glycomyces sp. TRM65418 TaxID=2867006 RepID=UPI001CE5A9E7|nr:SAF domain-containing protein [Glycomyces sp. TRM65418]MCC3762619.1 SAF domain-containing protein [Glycomyces sp. TRM65418]QZD56657.1 SAF domain-containing protein [Glycomyces sp. TRM65418]